jgi:hypothetical protein
MFTQALGTATTGFEGELRFEADIQGLATSVGRHPSANLLPIFNSSHRRLRELVAGYGYTQFCTRGVTTALPTTAVEAGETYATIDVGTAGAPGTVPVTQQIKMIDVKSVSGRWRTLPEITLLQLRDFATTTRGEPEGWCWVTAPNISSGTTLVAGKIAFTPVPVGGSYALWTMNELTMPSSTTDVYLYHNEDWRMWHMYDSISRIVGTRDKDTAKKLAFVLSRLDPEVEGSPAFNIKNQAPTAAGSKTMTRASNYRGIGGAWRR